MDAQQAKKLIEENLRYEEVKRLLVKLVQTPSPQTELLEEEPKVLSLIREIVKPELEASGVRSVIDDKGNLIARLPGKGAAKRLLLVAYAMVLTARNMMTGQSRPMMWAWFAGVTAVTMIAGFLFSMLDSLAMPSLLAVFWQFLATALLFPFAHRLVDRFDDADVRFR